MPKHGKQSRKRLQEAIDAFLRDLEGRCHQGARSGATLVMHRAHLRYIVDRIPPTTALADVTAELVDWFALRELEGRREDATGEKKPISPRTLEKRMCTLSLVLQSAQRRGWIEHMPRFPKLRARYVPNREHLRDFAELELLCNSLPVERGDWVWLAVFSGQRPGDLERMRAYVDCDPFARPPWMVLRHRKTRDPDGVLVRMPTPLANRLRASFERQGLRPGDPVVPHWDKDVRGKVLRRRRHQLGLAAWRATDFRRTCGSWAAHKLGTLTVGLKDWMGHADFGMLSRIYARALPPGFTDVSRALGAMARDGRRRGPRRKSSPKKEGSLSAPLPVGNGARGKNKVAAEGLPGPAAAVIQTGADTPQSSSPIRIRESNR